MKHMPSVQLSPLPSFRQKHPVSILLGKSKHLDISTKLLNTDQTELVS